MQLTLFPAADYDAVTLDVSTYDGQMTFAYNHLKPWPEGGETGQAVRKHPAQN